MLQNIKKFFDEKGQGIVEYALLLAFVVAIGAVVFTSTTTTGESENATTTTTGLQNAVEGSFNKAADTLKAKTGN